MKNPLDAHSDAAFFTRFGIVIGALVLLAGIFGAIAHALERHTQDPDDARLHAEVDHRTTPIANVVTSNEQLAALTPAAAAASSTPQSGDQIVAQVCGACHNAGLLGAPKAHDKSAWQPRLAANGGKVEGLVASATKGKGQMPPKGGAAQLTDEDLKKAIEFMLQ
jgi:cytochrome c5